MYPTIGRDRPPVRPVTTHDAVLVVPGIMGTELYEAATGRMLWGMAKVADLAARSHGHPVLKGAHFRLILPMG